MDLRVYLDQRIDDLNTQLEKVKSLYRLVDEVILARSFSRASAIAPSPPGHVELPTEAIEKIPIKTSTGLLLAHLYVQENEVRIVPAKELALSVKTPPFQSFLINRILDPMRDRSRVEVHKGNVTPTEAFTYDIVADEDTLEAIVIQNYVSRKRLREIVSSSRWTFEKMYEREVASR
jgi:hypothetical protein